MEKQELNYSDCKMFINYISKAKASLFALHFATCRKNIDSAKVMVIDWYCDGVINLRNAEWLTHLLNEAIEDYEADDSAILSESLDCIMHEFKKMMKRLDIKRDN